MKLWNKLLPACVPPVITLVFPDCVMLELLGKVPSGVIWARAQFAKKVYAPLSVIPNNQPQRVIIPDIAPPKRSALLNNGYAALVQSKSHLVVLKVTSVFFSVSEVRVICKNSYFFTKLHSPHNGSRNDYFSKP